MASGSGENSVASGGSDGGGSESSHYSTTPIDSKVQQIVDSVKQLKKTVDALTAKNRADVSILHLLGSPIHELSDTIEKNLAGVDRWVAKAPEPERINDVTLHEIGTYGIIAGLDEKLKEYTRSAEDLSKAMEELLKSVTDNLNSIIAHLKRIIW